MADVDAINFVLVFDGNVLFQMMMITCCLATSFHLEAFDFLWTIRGRYDYPLYLPLSVFLHLK